MENDVNTTHLVMLVFMNKQEYHQKSYSFMSLGFIQQQLADFHNKRISISAIKYHLAVIKQKGYMKFYKNKCGRRSDGTVYRKPSSRMFFVKGLQYFARCQTEVSDWLWDVVTQRVKLPRGKGLGYYEKKQLADQEAPDPPKGILKLISKIGKSVSDIKFFTW